VAEYAALQTHTSTAALPSGQNQPVKPYYPIYQDRYLWRKDAPMLAPSPVTPPKILLLTPLYVGDSPPGSGGHPLFALARGIVEGSGGQCTVDVVVFGPTDVDKGIGPGVRLRVLTAAFRGGQQLDLLSWELPAVLAEADVVHIQQAFTRTGEMGLLLAKMLHKRVCLTLGGITSSDLGTSLRFLDLADCLVCGPDFLAGRSEYERAVIVDTGDPQKAGKELWSIYRRLLVAGEVAA
jgi:hypothetical protein